MQSGPEGHSAVPLALARLRASRLFAWLLAYAAVAWVVVQAVALVADVFDWPGLVPRAGVLIAVWGVPVVVVVAWFHGTPERRHSRAAEVALLIACLAGAGITVFGQWRARPAPAVAGTAATPHDRAAAAPADPHSIAVLPFVNMSGDPAQEYFSDGLAEELLNALANVAELEVTARTSAFSFKGRNLPVQEIAQTLGVANLLEGSVRKSGTRLRVTAQLIRASDGFHYWSRTYDRTLNDVFAVQEDIARSVVAELKVTLLGGAERRLANRGTQNLEAYTHYLKARELLPRRKVAELKEAKAQLERAVQLDPNFAPGLALLGDTLHLLHEYADWPQDSLQAATAFIQRALAIDPELAEGYAYLAEIKRHEHDYAAAETLFQKALELRPNDAATLSRFSTLRELEGRLEEQHALLVRAHDLDPLSPTTHANVAWTLMTLARDTEALAELRRVHTLHPDFATGWLYEAWLHEFHGNPVDALRAARMAELVDPDSDASADVCLYLIDLVADREAETCLQEVLARRPEDHWGLIVRTRLYVARGERSKARQSVQAAARHDPVAPYWLVDDWPLILGPAQVDAREFAHARRVFSAAQPEWFNAAVPDVATRRLEAPVAAAAALRAAGENEQAARLLRAVLQRIASGHRALGNARFGHEDVAAYALLGDRERALEALAEVAKTSYLTRWRRLESVPQFDSIRDDPRFVRAVAVLRTKADAQREVASSEGLLDAAEFRARRGSQPAATVPSPAI